MEKLKKEFMELFKKYSKNNTIPADVLKQFIDNNKNTAHNVIDDLIQKGFIIEAKENNKPTFKLTKHDYNYIDEK